MIDRETIKKLAGLARIEVGPEREGQLADDVSKILDYVEDLKKVDTSNLAAVTQVTGLENIFREDELAARKEGAAEELLKDAPFTEKGFIKVKSVFE